MALISSQKAQLSANNITFSNASAGGDTFVNNGKEMMLIKHTNAAGSAVTVTVTTTMTVGGLAVADLAFTINPSEEHLIGPFGKDLFNDANDQVAISYSDATDIDLAIVSPT